MATYFIGDVHGCYLSLLKLLEVISFNERNDQLWFAGDLVNRGPQSLETLRFIISLGKSAKTILGNHDLHLIACSFEKKAKNKDTLEAILTASDKSELIDWLRQQPLVLHEPDKKWLMVHAGICPVWTLEETIQYSALIEQQLKQENLKEFIHSWYGDTPSKWDERLSSPEKERVIINYFTRMRILDAQQNMALNYKKGLESIPLGYMPWFQVKHNLPPNYRIAFGHWASLMGKTHTVGIGALDTGCVWGQFLTAFRIDDEQYFQVKAQD